MEAPPRETEKSLAKSASEVNTKSVEGEMGPPIPLLDTATAIQQGGVERSCSMSTSQCLPSGYLEDRKESASPQQRVLIRADLKKKLSLQLGFSARDVHKLVDSGPTQEERFKSALLDRVAEAQLEEFADMKGAFEAKYEIKETLGEVEKLESVVGHNRTRQTLLQQSHRSQCCRQDHPHQRRRNPQSRQK
jgi:hypothetical protein